MRIAVLASGRGSNLAAILANIKKGELPAEISVIVSDKENAYALEIGEKAGIDSLFLDPKKFESREIYDKALAEELKKYGVELVVLAGFMRILSPAFLDEFPQRVINIHPALLPCFPGLHAHEQAIEHGVKISGCTVHFVDSGMDSGPIIAQRAVPVLDTDTGEDLAGRILKEEHVLYSQVIKNIAEGKVSLAGNKVFCS